MPPAAACRFTAASPAPRRCIPSTRLTLTRRHRGFTGVHPSGLPLACDPRMERRSLGLNPELRTPPSPAAHVRAGTGAEHSPGATSSTPPTLQPTSPLTACDLVSHHPQGALLELGNCSLRQSRMLPTQGGHLAGAATQPPRHHR